MAKEGGERQAVGLGVIIEATQRSQTGQGRVVET